MNPYTRPTERQEAPDDAWLEQADGPEQLLLIAIRAWLRPHCGARHGTLRWGTLLRDAGMPLADIQHFDRAMLAMTEVAVRPLDIRCRCASDLASDEAMLLQAIALLQRARDEAATRLLRHSLSQAAASRLLMCLRGLAVALARAGVEVRVRERDFTYMH